MKIEITKVEAQIFKCLKEIMDNQEQLALAIMEEKKRIKIITFAEGEK